MARATPAAGGRGSSSTRRVARPARASSATPGRRSNTAAGRRRNVLYSPARRSSKSYLRIRSGRRRVRARPPCRIPGPSRDRSSLASLQRGFFWRRVLDRCALDQAADVALAVARAFPLVERRRQFAAIAAHLPYALINLGEARADDVAQFDARAVAALLVRDDAADFGEREPQDLRALDKFQPLQYLCVVEAIAALGARGPPKQSLLFVKAQRLNADAAQARDFADLQRRFARRRFCAGCFDRCFHLPFLS